MLQFTSTMKKFSIKDLENLSGIKAHTLRVWEHRYNFIKPQRTDANFRYYTVDELKQLLHLNLLNRNGHKISHLASLPNHEIELRVGELSSQEDRQQRALNDLLIYMYTLDIDGFEETLDHCFSSWPVTEVMEDILYVFLKKIDLLLSGSRLIEEHFVVTAIRKKMMIAIDAMPMPPAQAASVLLFLPESRQLDLGLLYAQYHLRKNGVQVLYMGSDVSVANLKSVFALKQPQFLFTYLPEKSRFRVQELMPLLQTELPDATLIIGNHFDGELLPSEHRQLKLLEYDQALTYICMQARQLS